MPILGMDRQRHRNQVIYIILYGHFMDTQILILHHCYQKYRSSFFPLSIILLRGILLSVEKRDLAQGPGKQPSWVAFCPQRYLAQETGKQRSWAAFHPKLNLVRGTGKKPRWAASHPWSNLAWGIGN